MRALPFIFSVIFCCALVKAYAQPAPFSLTNYNTENIGLTHNSVTGLAMDSRGFIWIGTIDGLNRFDGKGVKIYRHDPADSTSISNNFIHGISEDKNDNLWITTRDGGLNKFDLRTEVFTRYQYSESENNGIPNAPVYLTYTDHENNFWVSFGTETFGLFDRKRGVYKKGMVINEENGQPLSSPNSVIEFNDGSFLVASFDGLYFIPDSSLQAFTAMPDKMKIYAKTISAPGKRFTHNLYVQHLEVNNALWIKGSDAGIISIKWKDLPDFLKKIAKKGIYKNSSKKQFARRNNFLLTGSGDAGLAFINIKTHDIRYSKPVNGTSAMGIDNLYEDLKGGLWGFSWGSGFSRLREQRTFRLINSATHPTLTNEFMLSFEEETDKGIWLGTADGLAFLETDTGIITPFNEWNAKINSASIWSLDRTENGLWIVTINQGLFYVPVTDGHQDFDKAKEFNPENSFVTSYQLHQVFTDSRGWLWVGYEGDGLQLIKDPGNLINGNPVSIVNFDEDQPSENSIKGDKVREIYEDAEGNIWLAMMQNGFNRIRIENGEIGSVRNLQHNPDNENSLSFNDGRSIYQQNDSTFWFATYGGGINRWNSRTGTFLRLNKSNGLANNSTYGILPDHHPDFIWISTNNGLSRLNTKDLTFTNYTEEDGLQNREFNTGAFFRKSNEELLYGGIGGLNIINTRKVANETKAPPVFITQINLFDEPISADTSDLFIRHLELPYNQNFLSFEYAALDYDKPGHVQYAYQMEGVDENRVLASNRNFTSYPNLKPGEYTFNVKAANGNAVWNDTGATITILITPPWWQTLWFRLAAGAILLTAFILGIRYLSQKRLREQIRKMEVENKLRSERDRISRDLHDHVGSQLANIISGLSLVDKYNQTEQKEKGSQLMTSLKGDAQVTIKQLRETIWALNQNQVDLEGFIRHLKTYFKNQSALCEKLKINYTLQADENISLSSTQALNLFRIIQEASQNTFKYAEAKNLEISILKKNRILTVLVKDDGTFKETAESFGGGYGLGNMKKRAKELDGDIEIKTENGTEIKVSVKL